MLETWLTSCMLVHIPVIMYSGAAYPCVPIMRVVTYVSSPSGPSLARPKSESLAVKS